MRERVGLAYWSRIMLGVIILLAALVIGLMIVGWTDQAKEIMLRLI
jgi:hypothetical protein